MSHPRARAGYLAAGLAVTLSVTGAAAVQAQGSGQSSGSTTSAKSAVAAHANRFGFGPGQALAATSTFSDGAAGSTVRFDRTYRGLPVAGGDFVVHLDAAGHYRYGEGLRIAGLPASVSPSISKSAAIAAAAKGLGYTAASSTARLAVFGTAHGSPLAWQVNTQGKRADRADVTYVSARTGRTLASWPTVDTSKDVGTGKTLYSGTVPLNDLKTRRGKYKLQDNTRGKQQILNANHTGSQGVGTLFTGPDNVWGNGTESSVESAAADAAYGLANTWDFYLNTYGRNGIADDGNAARGFVHYSTGYRNAFWSDSCFCMEFGDGSGNWGPLTSLDVAGHEMTHGVTSRTAKLVYSGESGGLNESTSDVMGTQVEWYANNANDIADYMIGEEFYKPYDPENNYLRRMDNPSLDGGSKNCWYSGVGGVDVHYSSGVGNHAFYLLAEGSGAKTINGLAYNSPTCNGSTVTGIGHDKAAAIWYRALTQHWTSTTDYHAARAGMLLSATELYGSGSAEYNAVNAAWAAVNVS